MANRSSLDYSLKDDESEFAMPSVLNHCEESGMRPKSIIDPESDSDDVDIEVVAGSHSDNSSVMIKQEEFPN